MNNIIKVGAGTLAGAGLGSLTSKFASAAINKALLKKIEKLDDDFDDMLSKRQLELKSKLEKRAEDLKVLGQSHPNYILVKAEVTRLTKDLLATLRVDQLKVYNSIKIANADYLERTKNVSLVFSILGGFAGGIIVSQINK